MCLNSPSSTGVSLYKLLHRHRPLSAPDAGHRADCLQRPLRSRFQPRLMSSGSAAPDQGQSVSKKEITMRLYPVGLVATLALAVLVAPLSANAQLPGKVFRVGVLLPVSFGLPVHQAFKQRLQELGYIEGQNLAFEVGGAEGKLDRLPGLAAELVR